MINPCVLIPIYNHKDTIEAVLASLECLGLPCLIVDDGSDSATQQVLAVATAHYPWTHLIRQAPNAGKGSALTTGFHHAKAAGYTHAVQIDADGQHHTGDISRFLEVAAAHPEALILGKPIFGNDVPGSRYFGRKLSVWCARAETLSCAIGDPLFGFRVYPLAATVAVGERYRLGSRMDFDPDIAVRLYWSGVPVHNIETRVRYPPGGVSHFRLLRDNARISWMHTRLLIGMVFRLPRLLRRHGGTCHGGTCHWDT
jgi:glycosyltransferase involved in cell wall biosynthesis